MPRFSPYIPHWTKQWLAGMMGPSDILRRFGREAQIVWWWLVAGVTVLVDGINWTFTMCLPQGRRALALLRQSGQSIWSLQLLAYALAHVGGSIGAAFSRLMPRWPAWMYGILVFFLAFEVLYLISWFAFQIYSRRSSPPVAAVWPPEVDV